MLRMEPGSTRQRPARGVGVDLAMDRLRRGAIESCVLALLRGGAAYSYDVVTALAGVDGMVTSEGQLFSLLRYRLTYVNHSLTDVLDSYGGCCIEPDTAALGNKESRKEEGRRRRGRIP